MVRGIVMTMHMLKFYFIIAPRRFGSKYRIKEIAKLRLFDYIEVFYNMVRRHSGFGYLNPYKFDQLLEL